MIAANLLHWLVGLMPVLGFLAALLYLDGYKLLRLRVVIAIVASGIGVAYACYLANAFLGALLDLDFTRYSRYVAPVVEELGKALVIVVLIRMHRIGFLIDAAIAGFAVGSGFAIIENVYYQQVVPDAGIGTWIVRGFGTAVMHGGTTAIFAMTSLALVERARASGVAAFVPGFVLAVALHSAFNHLNGWPRLSTLAVMIVLPPLLMLIFQRSERAVSAWLGHGFDADTRMLESITSGQFADSPAGRYLASIRHRFKGAVVADLLCYLRLHTELALRAKGILMMRESGFEAAIDDVTRAKFAEMRYLERSVGRTGLLALGPLLHGSNRDVWQLKMLESEAVSSAAGARRAPAAGAR